MKKRLLVPLGLLLSVPAGVQAQSPGAGAGQPQDQAAYVARCTRETVAQYPNAAAQAQSICGSKWDMVVASFPIADAIVSLAPLPGAPFNPTGIRARVAAVQWRATPDAGSVASGSLGDVAVNIDDGGSRATLDWQKPGEPIPYDLEGALTARGASVTMIGCLSFGAGEGSRIYRVEPTGRAAFALSIDSREAAVASQSSSYLATVDYSGRLPTLAALKGDGNEWTATCAN